MARDFTPASTQYLENTTTPNITGTPFTVSIWALIDVDPTQNDYTLWQLQDKDVSDQYFRIEIGENTDPTPGELRSVAFAGGAPARATAALVTQDVWFHACGVFTSATSRDCFLNGGDKGSNADSEVPAGIDSMSIGREGDSSPGDEWAGRLAEVTLWNVALSDDEIVALAGGIHSLHIRPESIQHYFPIYGVGDPEPDLSGGGYSMTLFGAPPSADHAPVGPFGFDD